MSKETKAQIRVLVIQDRTQREIAEEVGQCKSPVGQYLRGFGVQKPCCKRGPPCKLSERKRRAIIRDARKGTMSARELADKHDAPVPIRRVQQILQSEPTLRWVRPKSVPHMLKRHKKQRRLWCGKMAAKDAAYWDRVIFSDEKRFLIDGPDGGFGFWHDTRTKHNRQGGGGDVMMWAAPSWWCARTR